MSSVPNLPPARVERMVLLSSAMTPRRLGRLVQQLLEIDSYRMMALLGLPVARQAFAALGSAERELDRRIVDIGESCLAGLQTLGEFIERRLAIEQQESSQALRVTMNQRQEMQLKLQSTVEGLSVAAITYSIVDLVNDLATGAQAFGWPLSPETTTAIAIPLVALGVWGLLRRLHARIRQG